MRRWSQLTSRLGLSEAQRLWDTNCPTDLAQPEERGKDICILSNWLGDRREPGVNFLDKAVAICPQQFIPREGANLKLLATNTPSGCIGPCSLVKGNGWGTSCVYTTSSDSSYKI